MMGFLYFFVFDGLILLFLLKLFPLCSDLLPCCFLSRFGVFIHCHQLQVILGCVTDLQLAATSVPHLATSVNVLVW